MLEISSAARTVIAIFTAISVILTGVLTIALEDNLRYQVRRIFQGKARGGRPPRKRPKWLWAVYWLLALAAAFGSTFLGLSPSPSNITTPADTEIAEGAETPPPPTILTNSPSTAATVSQITQTATGIWSGLQLRTPQPNTTPLPPAEHTPIDGVYAMLDESLPQWWACKRCADYRPGGGIWKLRFDRGIMRIYYDVTGWSSIASYTVSGERLFLFNDPFCPEEVGEYTWKLEDMWGLSDRSLTLETVSDACSIALRGQNLSRQAWLSCMPPNVMTGASGHYHMPPGCEEPRPPEPEPAERDPSVMVTVYAGYTHDFAVEPDIYANANSPENPVPEGISVVHSQESISYGLNRVLWGMGDWIEASTELSFTSMGVQILGDHTIGWARVLFDGVEVWRGNTAEIWSHLGRHGGYIEVSGYQKGMHTLRVESLGFDYHPVTVAYFGFSSEGGVRMAQP